MQFVQRRTTNRLDEVIIRFLAHLPMLHSALISLQRTSSLKGMIVSCILARIPENLRTLM